MGKMLKNEVAKNELKEVRHSEEWHKSGEKVKYRLADAMKSCMKKAPVEKITVKEITEECGVTRQTFYRNFQDKYDLINWYFDVLAQMSFKQMGISLTLREGLLKKFEFIKGEGQFFAAAFSSESQNCLMISAFINSIVISFTNRELIKFQKN